MKNFFDKDISRSGSAVTSAFIDAISAERRSYGVVCSISQQTANILNSIGKWKVVSIGDLPVHAQVEVVTWPDFEQTSKFIWETVTAADRYRAAMIVYDRLTSVRSLMVIPAQRLDIKWSSLSHVFRSRGTKGYPMITSESQLGVPAGKKISGRRLRQFTSIPRIIDAAFDEKSKERLTSSISTASVAFETSISETQLISLWSAFEVLLDDPPEEEARIKHYVSNLVPCICTRYNRRLFSAVYDQLVVMHRKSLGAVISQIAGSASTSAHTKFAKLITLPEYQAQRAQLLNLCAENPLALHRLFRLHKFYGTPHATLASLNEHSDRVTWQLHRIYRTRNNLVHAGKSPVYLDALVQNALEYFRNTVVTISKSAQNFGKEQSVDQVVAEIGFDWRAQLEKLKGVPKNGTFNNQLVLDIFASL